MKLEKKTRFEITSATLHIMAMLFMLCDHLWGTVVPGNDWLTCIGRLAYPIFAFMIVEGYFHTSDFKKYLKRIFVFALISEIPFNLALGSRLFYPIHQNVLWSFLLSLLLIHWNEKTKDKGIFRRIIVAVMSAIIGAFVGLITMVDFYHAGVLTVLVFYFFRQRKWWSYIAQFICLWYINVEVLSGYAYQIQLFGNTYFFVRQGFALLALIPIWLYNGRQGLHTKAFRQLCYWFYPVHLLILGLLKFL